MSNGVELYIILKFRISSLDLTLTKNPYLATFGWFCDAGSYTCILLPVQVRNYQYNVN